MTNLIGWLIMAACVSALWYFHFHSILLYGTLAACVLFNKVLPKLFILWLLIAMGAAFFFTAGNWEPLIVFIIGMFGVGLVLEVI